MTSRWPGCVFYNWDTTFLVEGTCMAIKRILSQPRLRSVPAQFSWVDPRLVFEGHLGRLDEHAATLYLLLVTVADAQGLSYWGDARVTQLLHITRERLDRSRRQLVDAGLLAYEAPLYQVLALQTWTPSLRPPAPSLTPSLPRPLPPTPTPPPASSIVDRAEALQRLAALRSRLASKG
jgi:hypothetical protein